MSLKVLYSWSNDGTTSSNFHCDSFGDQGELDWFADWLLGYSGACDRSTSGVSYSSFHGVSLEDKGVFDCSLRDATSSCLHGFSLENTDGNDWSIDSVTFVS